MIIYIYFYIRIMNLKVTTAIRISEFHKWMQMKCYENIDNKRKLIV